MLEVVPYELDDIKNTLKRKAIEEFGLSDAEFEGSNISQLINLLAYSTVINHTNLTFGLNEMFITQAVDRRNVIKHARQMGYTHKRKVSFQYRIKLKVTKTGEVILNKYSNFTSNGNNYIYLGESILDTYGTYAYIKMLTNEFNNSLAANYTSISLTKNKFIISEEGQVCKILNREEVGSPRLLLDIIDGDTLPIYSQLGKEVYICDGTRSEGYRNFIKIGTVDTFVTDYTNNYFKMQISLDNDDITFPLSLNEEHTPNKLTRDGDYFIMELPTKYPINDLESISLNDYGDEIKVDPSEVILESNNVKLPIDFLRVQETFGIEGKEVNVLDEVTHEVSIVTDEEIIPETLEIIKISYNNITTLKENKNINYDENEITIAPFELSRAEDKIEILEGIIYLDEITVKSIKSVIVVDPEGNKSIISSDNYTFNENSVTLTKDGEATSDYDDYTAEVEYFYWVPLEQATIEISYECVKDLTGMEVSISYNYVKDEEGYLARRIFFSDLRGETKENENDYDPLNMPEGWDGFYASSFDSETNVLYFDISETEPSVRSHNNSFHNCYCSIDGEAPLRLDKIFTNPFRKTRFSYSSEILDATGEVTGYTPFNKDLTFANVLSTNVKDEIEIVVKEGTIKRWNEETEESVLARQSALDAGTPLPKIVYANPELTIPVSVEIAEAGHFTIFNNDIEDDGIELFVTRIAGGGVEYDVPWTKRNYLLAEKVSGDERTYVVMSDLEYEDYLNIYTKYAGTGTPLSQDMVLKLNILSSKGPLGITNSLIEPLDDQFEAKYYIEETLTPNVLHIEGTEIQDTDSIRESAHLFSNTANRAVTKKDYKTICEAQPFIQSAQIWGGEEETPINKPGHIFFSFIPYSRPSSFLKSVEGYTLQFTDKTELFFTPYYQITGRESYDKEQNKTDQSVIFNMLENYKIITLQLNYIKPIYLDYKVKVKIYKYKFGQTIDETNESIFLNLKEFFSEEVEHFESTFYSSSMIRTIDEKMGDSYGIEVEASFSVDLYDSFYEPDKGCFKNVTLEDLDGTDNTLGIVGDEDLWRFTLPLTWPIEDLYADDTIADGLLISYGRMITDNLTTCNTESFLKQGDSLFMEIDDNTFKSWDINKVLEDIYTNSRSEITEISIMYKKEVNGEIFKVGSYWIHKAEKTIRLELNTHTLWHVDSQAVVTEKMIEEGKEYEKDGEKALYTEEEIGLPIFYKVHQTDEGDSKAGDYVLIDNKKVEILIEVEERDEYPNIRKPYTNDLPIKVFTDEVGTEKYQYKECPLPRSSFVDSTKVMSVNPKNNNIITTRNVFSRFKSIEFSH